MPSQTSDCKIPINTLPPLLEPYRTGSYLIYDYVPGNTPTQRPSGCPPMDETHFRDGTTIGLRASGSRQLDFQPFAQKLRTVAAYVKPNGRLYVVDLRQESHVFFDNSAVSWYADKDWANVGQSEQSILRDEANQIASVSGAGKNTVQIFCVDQASKSAGQIIPTGYSDVAVTLAASEEQILNKMNLSCPVEYVRIPVTDHCMPNPEAWRKFIALCSKLIPLRDWVHFHCHGGDGRTTTFLAMYDMFCWAQSKKQPVPCVQNFSNRQWSLFCYCLDPTGCDGIDVRSNWKSALAVARWKWLFEWHHRVFGSGLEKRNPLKFRETHEVPRARGRRKH